MSNSERRNYARRNNGYMHARAVDPVYNELERYAGELLTIESLRIGVQASKIAATVRCIADDKTFEIAVYKPEMALLTQAGYTLPTSFGEHAFTATVTCVFVQSKREGGLQIDWVEPFNKIESITLLARQSAIEWLLKHDSYLQKLVWSVWSQYDAYGVPSIKIEVHSRNRTTIENALAPLVAGITIEWKVIGHAPFAGTFDDTERIPVIDTLEDVA